MLNNNEVAGYLSYSMDMTGKFTAFSGESHPDSPLVWPVDRCAAETFTSAVVKKMFQVSAQVNRSLPRSKLHHMVKGCGHIISTTICEPFPRFCHKTKRMQLSRCCSGFYLLELRGRA